jgi:hypothetical protein
MIERMVVRLFALLAVLVLGSGCSVQFAYNNLDRLVRWGVNDYVNMNDAQRNLFNEEFARLHYWHRTEHMPLYADFFEALPTTLSDGVDAQELLALENTMMGWAKEIVETGAPLAVAIMQTMTDEQVAGLPARLEESNREIEKTELGKSVEASQARWREEVEDIFTRFAGRLTPAQQEYLVAQSVRYIPERVLWAEYRRRWQRDLMKLLQARSEPAFADRFAELAANREAYFGAELTAIFDNNENLGRETAAWLLNHMAERQSVRMYTRFVELAIDFRELADDAPNWLPPEEPCQITC